MRLVFFGTPEVAAVGLRALLASQHEIACIVSQPDRGRGRGREVSASPVKQLALEHGIPTLQPESPKQEGFADALSVFEPQALAVIAYGHILPLDVLQVAPALNVHFSLLPRYRGAAPVQRALMDGVAETGVSVFLLEPTVDTGPVLVREAIPVAQTDTSGDVLERLAPLGAALLLRALSMLETGTVEGEPQDSSLASPAPKIKPEEATIDWRSPASHIGNLVRALNPRPGAHTVFRGKRLTVWRAHATDAHGPPGTVLSAGEDGLVIAAGTGAIVLDEVQLEGKRPVRSADFVRGYHPPVGDLLDGDAGPGG